MLPVIQRTAPAYLREDLNPFLFAFVGTDRAGGQLSVVSALARLDLDAWSEAAALARLPRAAAASKLSAVLRRYTEIPHIAQEASGIAARLVALLPERTPVRLQKPAGKAAAVPAALLAFAILFGMMYFYQAHAPAAVPASPAGAQALPLAPPP
jgi:hypothetical protein